MKKIIFVLIVVSLLFLGSGVVQAQESKGVGAANTYEDDPSKDTNKEGMDNVFSPDPGSNLNRVAQEAGIRESNIAEVVGGFINAILSLVGMIFLVLMVYAGVLWMTARGEEDQVTKARKVIYASIIGLFITVSAYAITIFVTGRF